jgi:threonine/homoserine/homoserine lactone efflux protein
MYRETSKRLEARESNFRSNGAMYRRGIITNITNPKVSIFFLAFLPQFASPEYGPVTTQMFILGGIFICVAMLIFSAVALLADAIGEWLNSWPKARVYLCRIAGAVFAGLALKLAISSAPGG